jgi:hypothetical protein
VFVGSILAELSSAAGFAAATMALCGFLAHAKPALAREQESELRRATVLGGLTGLSLAVSIVVGILWLT